MVFPRPEYWIELPFPSLGEMATQSSILAWEKPWIEYWIELPFPSLGELPSPGIKPASPSLAGGFFTAEPPGELPGILVFNENIWVLSLKVESIDGKWREVGM